MEDQGALAYRILMGDGNGNVGLIRKVDGMSADLTKIRNTGDQLVGLAYKILGAVLASIILGGLSFLWIGVSQSIRGTTQSTTQNVGSGGDHPTSRRTWLTVHEVADNEGVTEDAVRAAISSGLIKEVQKVSGEWRILPTYVWRATPLEP